MFLGNQPAQKVRLADRVPLQRQFETIRIIRRSIGL
jgi:hypothetical protein